MKKNSINNDIVKILSSNRITIYFLGKHQVQYKQSFLKYINKIDNEEDDDIRIRTYENQFCNVKYIQKKSLDNIIFDKKDELIKDINSFISNGDLLKRHGIINKLGILLYGEPGTGKTSIARAIADYVNATSINIVSAVSLSHSSFLSSFESNIYEDRNIDEIIVILIEDIDLIFVNREDDSKKSDEALIRTQQLFQLLDGVESIPNSIIIATTNYIDRLDEALIRPSRFSTQLEISLLDKAFAINLCELFDLARDQISDLLKDEKFPINPAYLQDKIIQSLSK